MATCTYAHAHAHAPRYPHERTHACTHRPVSNTYCFSTATVSRERALVLRHTCIVCLVNFSEGSSGNRARCEIYPVRHITAFRSNVHCTLHLARLIQSIPRILFTLPCNALPPLVTSVLTSSSSSSTPFTPRYSTGP